MSGLGGIIGVCTTFGTVKVSPGLPVLVTVCGSTPGFAAEAVATATTATSATRIRTAYGRRSLSVRIILSPLTWMSVSHTVGKGDATFAEGSQLPVTASLQDRHGPHLTESRRLMKFAVRLPSDWHVTPLTQRTGVLVLRVWLEDGEQDGLRARITETLDISTPDEIERAAVGEDAILRAVGVWLRSFLGETEAQSQDRSA